MINLNNKEEYNKVKKNALIDFGVVKTEKFNVKETIRARIDFLKDYIRSNNLKAIILGISGGVDSTSAGKLSQLAMTELQEEGYKAQFIAVRLPAHIQKDEEDAQRALKFINPDQQHTINIGQAADTISLEGVNSFGENNFTPAQIDFNKGNIKARMRMIAQYQLAAFYNGIVLGTDHNAEGILSFYTHH
jgi:NAD+ synthase